MLLTRLFYLVIFFFIISCSRLSKGEIITKNGYSVYFHKLGASSKSVFQGCVVNLNLVTLDSNKRVLFSSSYHGLQGVSSFYYDSTILDSPLEEVFSKTYMGDSFSLELPSKVFFNTFFGKQFNFKNHIIDCPKMLFLHVKILGFNSLKEQIQINSKLKLSAINLEEKLLNEIRKEWDNKFLNIYKNKGMYSIKIASDNRNNLRVDSNNQYISINYSINDLNDRMLYTTNSSSEFYDKSLNGQLLEGFQLLVNRYKQGDSIIAIMPSSLLFSKRGSFVNRIPPFTPAKINLRIN